MLLKIVNENRGSFPFLTFGDIANQQHTFEWNEKVGAYCYEPKNQIESDNITATNWVSLHHPWRVSPVWNGAGMPVAAIPNAAVPSTVRIPPYVRPDLYDAYPLEDLLALCADAGFTPEGDATNTFQVRHQLHRYYEGRAWAVEDMKRLRAQLAAPKSVAAPETPAPDILPPPVKRGRGRPRKVLQPA